MLWILYIDGKALCSFIHLPNAVDAAWPFIQERRDVKIVRKQG